MIYINPNNKALLIYSITHCTRNLQLSESVSRAHVQLQNVSVAVVVLAISPQFANLHLSEECCRIPILILQKSLFTQLLELPSVTSHLYAVSLQG